MSAPRTRPLIGLPGRIGTLAQQGSHPGPLSFYSLAPFYRLFGSSSWALEAATARVEHHRHRHQPRARPPPRRLSPRDRCRGRARVPGAWVRRRDAHRAVEPVPPAAVVGRAAARGVVGGVRRLHRPAARRLRGLVLRADAPAVSRPVARPRRARDRGCGRHRAARAGQVAGAEAVREVDTRRARARVWRCGRRSSSTKCATTPATSRLLRDYFQHPPEQPVGLRTGVRLELLHLDISKLDAGPAQRHRLTRQRRGRSRRLDRARARDARRCGRRVSCSPATSDTRGCCACTS